jgi:Secretion system C-terminal sorting domain
MKKKIIYGIVFFTNIICAQAAFGQTSINAASHTSQTVNGEHTYSIGEMALVHTATNPHLIVTQGQLQPSDESSSNALADLQTKIEVFPNPVSEVVYAQLQLNGISDVSLRLMDINGKLIAQQQYNAVDGNQRFAMDVQAFANGQYVLMASITQGKQVQQLSFKIIKK